MGIDRVEERPRPGVVGGKSGKFRNKVDAALEFPTLEFSEVRKGGMGGHGQLEVLDEAQDVVFCRLSKEELVKVRKGLEDLREGPVGEFLLECVRKRARARPALGPRGFDAIVMEALSEREKAAVAKERFHLSTDQEIQDMWARVASAGPEIRCDGDVGTRRERTAGFESDFSSEVISMSCVSDVAGRTGLSQCVRSQKRLAVDKVSDSTARRTRRQSSVEN